MKEGTVKWFNVDEGYGFIQQDSGRSIYVHTKGLSGRLIQVGDRVRFYVSEGIRGPTATNVTAS